MKPELPPPASMSNEAVREKYPAVLSYDDATREVKERAGDGATLRNDPAFAPEGDPLKVPGTRAYATVVKRSIPLVVVQNSWTVQSAKNALASHSMGVFESSGQLAISIRGDPRVTAALGSLRAGFFGREVRFRPANDSAAAKEVLDAWTAHWPQFEASSDMGLMSDYERLMGFADAQLLWDTGGKLWLPYMRYWFSRYEYWNWDIRKFVAITQDGTFAILPGNGKWVHHSRFGSERCWDMGAVRPITEPYLGRHWARRDWLRYSEKHGLPTEVAETPMAADPIERSQFVEALANRGSEATVLIGKGVDKESSYDLRLIEAMDKAWESFPGLIQSCDADIVLALMFQSMTTEATEGALKAEISAGMDIREAGIQDDNTAWRTTIRRDVARPFAFFNFGDPDLAPWTERDVASRAMYDANAKKFQAFGTGLQAMTTAGYKFKEPKQLQAYAAKAFGLDEMPEIEIVEAPPVPVKPGEEPPATPAPKKKPPPKPKDEEDD